MRKFLAVPLTALAFAAACGDAPTAVEQENLTPAGPSIIVASAEDVADYAVMLKDASERLVPALNSPATAERLVPQLQQLATAMKMRDTNGARAAFEAAQEVLKAYRTTSADSGDFAADADAIQIVLDQADAMIGAALPE
jgi:uncharacterized lipoprotein YajG